MDELRWYLYDLVREIMEKHGIEEAACSLETVREGAVCLIPSDHGFLVAGAEMKTRNRKIFTAVAGNFSCGFSGMMRRRKRPCRNF